MTEDTQCPSCGRKDFASKGGMKIHHSLSHGESIAGVELICENCNEKYREESNREERSSYCSKECMYEANQEKYSGKGNPSWSGGKMEHICDWCGEYFTGIRKYNGKEHAFCDKDCYGKWQSENRVGKEAAGYNGGNKRYHAALRDAISFSGWDKSWHMRRKEYRTDNDTSCKMCKSTIGKRKNDLHHIIPVLSGGVHSDELLMPLCMSCHRKVEAYSKDFTEKYLLPDENQS